MHILWSCDGHCLQNQAEVGGAKTGYAAGIALRACDLATRAASQQPRESSDVKLCFVTCYVRESRTDCIQHTQSAHNKWIKIKQPRARLCVCVCARVFCAPIDCSLTSERRFLYKSRELHSGRREQQHFLSTVCDSLCFTVRRRARGACVQHNQVCTWSPRPLAQTKFTPSSALSYFIAHTLLFYLLFLSSFYSLDLHRLLYLPGSRRGDDFL